MLQLIDGLRRVAAQIFDRVLVSEPVGALDGVVHVPFPVVRPHVAERRGDAALRRDRVRTRRKDLGHAGDVQPRLGAADDGAQSGAAGADDHHVEGVIDDRIGPPPTDTFDAELAAALAIRSHSRTSLRCYDGIVEIKRRMSRATLGAATLSIATLASDPDRRP